MANTGDSFHLKILTPAGLALMDVATEVYLPSSDGEIGVLPGHCIYTGLLGTGTLRFHSDNGDSRRVQISGGFCNFANNTLTILADRVQIEA